MYQVYYNNAANECSIIDASGEIVWGLDYLSHSDYIKSFDDLEKAKVYAENYHHAKGYICAYFNSRSRFYIIDPKYNWRGSLFHCYNRTEYTYNSEDEKDKIIKELEKNGYYHYIQ